MEQYAIINGNTMYLKEFWNKPEAITWTQNHCDFSKEVIVRQVSIIEKLTKQ